MAKRSIKIRGRIPELGEVPKKVLREALPRVINEVADSARQEAPKRRGYGSPKSIVSRIGGRVLIVGEKGVVWSRAPHSHLIELGVSAHPLAAKRKRKRNKRAMTIYGSREILRTSAQHPGIGKNPYMERAIPGARREIDKVLADEGRKELLDAVLNAANVLEGGVS